MHRRYFPDDRHLSAALFGTVLRPFEMVPRRVAAQLRPSSPGHGGHNHDRRFQAGQDDGQRGSPRGASDQRGLRARMERDLVVQHRPREGLLPLRALLRRGDTKRAAQHTEVAQGHPLLGRAEGKILAVRSNHKGKSSCPLLK